MRAALVLAAASIALPALAATDAGARAPRMDRIAQCSWDRPGHNPFMGEVVPAIDRYADIPTPVRMRLKERMAQRRYDDLVEIRRDSIRGKHDYGAEIRDMHFGLDRVCGQVTRSAWSESMRERGLVYCDSGHCILVPTVCRNVSRIERRRPAVAAAPGASEAPPLAQQPLVFDPPSAGPEATAQETFASAAGAGSTPAWSDVGHGSGGMSPPPGSWSSRPIAPVFETGSGATGGSPLPPSRERPPVVTDPVPVLTPIATPVPEPSTWAMMLLGLAAVAGVARRRRPSC
jgi:hypothetical protein